VLIDENGKAYSFAGAKLINLASGEEKLFFTKKDGGFYIENLHPDNYQIIVIDRGQLRSGTLDLNNKLKDERNSIGKIIIKRK